jgi:hypothetical protein
MVISLNGWVVAAEAVLCDAYRGNNFSKLRSNIWSQQRETTSNSPLAMSQAMSREKDNAARLHIQICYGQRYSAK